MYHNGQYTITTILTTTCKAMAIYIRVVISSYTWSHRDCFVCLIFFCFVLFYTMVNILIDWSGWHFTLLKCQCFMKNFNRMVQRNLKLWNRVYTQLWNNLKYQNETYSIKSLPLELLLIFFLPNTVNFSW